MDDKTVRVVEQHYNSKANQGTSKEALRRRRQGPALPLKKFHNHIKDLLIQRFCHGAANVLDFCCGRGGDIRKWDSAKVKYVKGIDLSKEEIEEAERRFEEYRTSQESEIKIEFQSSDVLGRGIYTDTMAPYDAVSCFFALHYFMVTKEAVSNLFLNVTNNLKLGGYFICTCPDGKRVLSAFTHSTSKEKLLQTPMLTIIPKWKGGYECFGSAFICSITDTVTEGVKDADGSYEYLVFTTPLRHIAAEHGLRLICNYQDPELNKLFDKDDEGVGFKHFHPRFFNSDPSLELASALNMAFVFQKVVEVKDREKPYTLQEIETFEISLPSASESSGQHKRKASDDIKDRNSSIDHDAKKARTTMKSDKGPESTSP